MMNKYVKADPFLLTTLKNQHLCIQLYFSFVYEVNINRYQQNLGLANQMSNDINRWKVSVVRMRKHANKLTRTILNQGGK